MKLLIGSFAGLLLMNGALAQPYAKLNVLPTVVEDWRGQTGWTIVNVHLIDPEWTDQSAESTLRLAVRERDKPKRLVDISPATAWRRGFSLDRLREYLHSPRHGLTLRLGHELSVDGETVEDIRLDLNCDADLSAPTVATTE